MKKALVILLILAVAGGLFAQDFTIGGLVNTGVKFSGGDGQAARAEAWHDDNGVTRVELNGAYTAENYGAVIGLRSNDFTATTDPLIRNGYVWAEFLNDIINVKGGLIDDAAWSTGGPEDFNISNGGGVRFEIKPIAGLNFGFFLTPQGHKRGPAIAFEYFFLETGIGAKYEHEIVDVALGVKLDSKGDGLISNEGYFDGSDIGTEFRDGTFVDSDGSFVLSGGADAIFGINVKAVENLTAQVEGKLYNLGAFGDAGWIWFIENFAYQVLDPLQVGVEFRQVLFGGDLAKRLPVTAEEKAGPWIKFKPYVGYDITPALNAGLEVGFLLQPEVIKYELNIRPKVTYKLADNAKIVTYYDFDTKKPAGEGAESINMNTVQINMEWSF